MIKSTFDIDTVAEAVGFWIPGFRADLVAGPGDRQITGSGAPGTS